MTTSTGGNGIGLDRGDDLRIGTDLAILHDVGAVADPTLHAAPGTGPVATDSDPRSEAAEPRLRPGTWLGNRYQLGVPVLYGPLAEVWAGVDGEQGRAVDVTVLMPELTADEAARREFRDRARASMALSHPGVAIASDYGEAVPVTPPGAEPVRPEDSPAMSYLVCDSVPGVPITEGRDDSGRTGLARMLDLLAQAARALEAVHAAGLVHGDLRPDNLVLTPDRRIVMVNLAVPGADVGSPYLAPDAVRPGDGGATPLSDVYALGVVAFECLAGHCPFDPDEAMEIAAAPWGADPPSLPETFPADVRWVIATAMQVDPRRRFNSAAQFADALEDLASRLLAGEVTPTVTLRRLEAPAQRTEHSIHAPGGHRGRQPRWLFGWLPAQLSARLRTDLRASARTAARHWRRPRVLFTRLLTLAAIVVVLLIGARMVQLALHPSARPPDSVVLHMVDAGGGSAAEQDAATTPQRTMTLHALPAGRVAVPDESRMPIDVAVRDVVAAGLKIGEAIPQDSVDVAGGAVIGTDPAAGTALAQGATVNLYVSTGKVRVPDLTGKPLAAALAVFRDQLHLQVTVARQNCTAARGTVADQSVKNASAPQRGRLIVLTCTGPTAPAPTSPAASPAPAPTSTPGPAPASPTPSATATPTPTSTPTASDTPSPTPTATTTAAVPAAVPSALAAIG